jgi:hypothetical protein
MQVEIVTARMRCMPGLLSITNVQGAKVIAVGLGEPVQARRFAEILSFPVDILNSDPEGTAHSALGFR